MDQLFLELKLFGKIYMDKMQRLRLAVNINIGLQTISFQGSDDASESELRKYKGAVYVNLYNDL